MLKRTNGLKEINRKFGSEGTESVDLYSTLRRMDRPKRVNGEFEVYLDLLLLYTKGKGWIQENQWVSGGD